VQRLVLLDGQFDRLPGVVAEGRRVIANIERVSMLFLAKTAYAFEVLFRFHRRRLNADPALRH
jgi:cation-transporting ATPase E